MVSKFLNSSKSDWEVGDAWSVEKDYEAVLYPKQDLERLVISAKGEGRGNMILASSKYLVMHKLLQFCLVGGGIQIGKFLKEKYEKLRLCLTCP